MSSQSSGVDPLTASATPLQTFKGAKAQAKATGFFYRNKDRLFLITNRHVVIDEKKNYKPNRLRFRVHTDPKDLCKNSDVDLPLYQGSQKVWREFNDKTIDIVAIELDTLKMQNYVVAPFSKEILPPNDLLIGLGENVLVMGYPLGFYDDVFNLPIIRNATVASIYPVPFQGKPYFLIDARLHPGTSGSPVILKPTNILRRKESTDFLSGFATFLLGIHSHTWPVPKDMEPLGLNAVWFSTLIEKLTG